jgi:hypothetical protein
VRMQAAPTPHAQAVPTLLLALIAEPSPESTRHHLKLRMLLLMAQVGVVAIVTADETLDGVAIVGDLERGGGAVVAARAAAIPRPAPVTGMLLVVVRGAAIGPAPRAQVMMTAATSVMADERGGGGVVLHAEVPEGARQARDVAVAVEWCRPHLSASPRHAPGEVSSHASPPPPSP